MAEQGTSGAPPAQPQLINLDNLKSEIEVMDMDPGAGQCPGKRDRVLRKSGPAGRTMLDLRNPMFAHPLEVEAAVALESGGKPKVEDMRKVIYGPQCWKCFGYQTWWKCQGCSKSYHKKCAFFGPNFPHPIFNLGVNEAVLAKKGVTLLVKCTQCRLAENTCIPRLRVVPLPDLNKIFGNVASLVAQQFRSVMPEITKRDDNLVSLAMIRDTLVCYPGYYKTLEAFSADYRLIKFQFIRRFGIESEESEVVGSVLDFLRKELNVAITCWECYLRRYDRVQLGRLLMPASAFYRVMEVSCRAPHPVIFAQIPEYSSYFWPAKLLFVDEVTGNCCFHCFEEKAVRFVTEGVKVYFYAKQDPNKQETDRRRGRKSQTQPRLQLNKAMASCGRYLENLRGRFGADKILIQEEMEAFSGSYAQAFQKMFPSLDMKSLLAGTAETPEGGSNSN